MHYTYKPFGVKETLQDKGYSNWCKKITQGTNPESLRCGGDDFQVNPNYINIDDDKRYSS